MEKEIRCYGCGSIIQSDDVHRIGYVPKNALNKDYVLCQRCFKMNHYHQLQASPLQADDFLRILQDIGEKDALMVYVIDLFDINGSIISGLSRHLNHQDILVLANKRDILPKSCNDRKIEHWVRRHLKPYNIFPKEVILTSAKKNYHLDEIIDTIETLRKGKDVYVLGMTNVGKSTFINALLKSYANETKRFITVSEFPGTTLDLIEIPLDDSSSLYDTPGIVNDGSYIHYIKMEDLTKILPQTELRPATYQLEEKQSLYIEGLARFDFVKGEKSSYTAYFSRNLKIHRTKLENADKLYTNQQLLPLRVESIQSIEEFITHSYKLTEGKWDIVIAGLGWLSVVGHGQNISVKTPKGVDVFIRESLI